MAQYIDKSALVAELERLSAYLDSLHEQRIIEKILYILDTLEVKEVDWELNSFDATVCKNGNTYLKEMDKDAIIKALEPYKEGDKVKVIIKSPKGE